MAGIGTASADAEWWWNVGTLGDFGMPESFRTCPLRVAVATGPGMDVDFWCVGQRGDCGMEGSRVEREGEDVDVGGGRPSMLVADAAGESRCVFASLHSCDVEV